MPYFFHYKFFLFFRSHFLYNIPEEDAEFEDELGVVTDDHHVKDDEENDVDLAIAPLPDSIQEDLVDDDNQLQSTVVPLPLDAG